MTDSQLPYTAVDLLWGKNPASWVVLVPEPLFLGFIFLAASHSFGLCTENPLISLAQRNPFPAGATRFDMESMISSKDFGWCWSLLPDSAESPVTWELITSIWVLPILQYFPATLQHHWKRCTRFLPAHIKIIHNLVHESANYSER